jgi:hypothetical protein
MELTFLCAAPFVLDTGNPLLASAHLDASMEGPETFDNAVTGGTYDCFGATAAVSITDMSTAEELVSPFEADVVLLDR